MDQALFNIFSSVIFVPFLNNDMLVLAPSFLMES